MVVLSKLRVKNIVEMGAQVGYKGVIAFRGLSVTYTANTVRMAFACLSCTVGQYDI